MPQPGAACDHETIASVPRTVNKKLLIDAIGVLVLALVVVVGYKLSPLLLAKADVTASVPDCDLRERACAADLPGGGRLEFSVSPRPVPMAQPLELRATVSGREVAKVEVDFAGMGMDMGLNRPQLAPAGPGVFAGRGSLPVCVTGPMDWRATVYVETARERIAVPFRLTSGTH